MRCSFGKRFVPKPERLVLAAARYHVHRRCVVFRPNPRNAGWGGPYFTNQRPPAIRQAPAQMLHS
ncbi:MAG: hypothetical protein ACR2O2_07705 [Ruegeria sp.]